jgi:hypothetical protein
MARWLSLDQDAQVVHDRRHEKDYETVTIAPAAESGVVIVAVGIVGLAQHPIRRR